MSISCSWLIIRELWQFILFSLFVSLPHRLQASSFSLIATLNPLLGFPNLPHPGGVVYGSISSKSLQNLPLPLHLCCSFLTSFSPPFLELAHINGFLFALSPIFYTSFFPEECLLASSLSFEINDSSHVILFPHGMHSADGTMSLPEVYPLQVLIMTITEITTIVIY